MSEVLFQKIIEAGQKGQGVALCTITEANGSTPRHEGSKMLVYEDGSFSGTVGGGELENRVRQVALETLETGKARKVNYSMTDPARGDPGVCGGQVEVFVEPILPKARLVVIGGGHVGKAVAHLAKWMGYTVAVSDDRAEFCTPEANPDADEFYPVSMTELPRQLNINRQTYLVLTTRGSNVDVEGMPALLESKAGYIGVIGSRRRWSTTVSGLKAKGVSDEALARVHSPLGLELNAETPEEIAVSIMAEITMLKNGGDGQQMRAKK